METNDSEVTAALSRFHEDVPHRFQVSLTMSMQSRELLGTIRDELNETAGEQVATTNDVLQIALLAATRYHALAAEEVGGADSTDEVESVGQTDDDLLPLAGVVRSVVEDADISDGIEEA